MRKICKMFENGNVCVYGLRGTGKDLLTANVISRRRLPYVSNVPYGGTHYPLDFDKLDCGKNDYRDFISGKLKPYVYPYPERTDVYISDSGIYLPAQYCNELNRDYKYLPTFFALSRHVGLANVHTNCQALGRTWDKTREQSDQFILCLWSKVFFHKLVIQKVRIYDKYQSAVDKVLPFSVHAPLMASPQTLTNVKLMKEQHQSTYGTIKTRYLFYINKSDYDTRYFKEVLKP